jgi:molybdopterin-guanine dinucleotide biosynthesis protein A
MHLCSGVILAGGASRRMGRDKAWIELDGRALVERVVQRLGDVCRETILVSGDQDPYHKLGVRVIGDTLPGKGSLGGIYSGLRAARFERAVVVACDMPFLNPALLDYMLSLAADYDVVIPSASSFRLPLGSIEAEPGDSKRKLLTAKDNDLHPLHAVYSKQCLEPIKARLLEGDLRMIGFHQDVRVRVVTSAEVEQIDPDHLSLLNVNTPQDLALAESLVIMEHSGRND